MLNVGAETRQRRGTKGGAYAKSEQTRAAVAARSGCFIACHGRRGRHLLCCCRRAMTTTIRLPRRCSFWRWCSSRALPAAICPVCWRRRSAWVGVNYLFTYPFHAIPISLHRRLPADVCGHAGRERALEHPHHADQRQGRLRATRRERTACAANLLLASRTISTAARGDHGPECNGRGRAKRSRTRGAAWSARSARTRSGCCTCRKTSCPSRASARRASSSRSRTRSSRRSSAAPSGAFAKLRHGHPHRGHKAGGDPARADGRHAHRAGAAEPAGKTSPGTAVGDGDLHRDPRRGQPRLADRGGQRRRHPAAAARRAL